MIGDLLEAALAVVRPLEGMSPSEFAARHRHLKEGTTASPGPWSNDVFPYLVPIMNVIQEAVETGKDVVLMKSAQGGGSEAMINALLWLLTYFPGPALYMISKDDLAREFGRDRFAPACQTCEPVAKKHLSGKGHGELIQVKRFVDGKLVLVGGRSVLNLQSQPYRIVFLDEVDSLLDEIKGHGDPIKLAQIRTDAYAEFGPTITVAFAHPSTKDRGAGKLFYESSDQRRGFVPCPHCGTWFPLRWEDVKVIPEEGEELAAATRDPEAYAYITPCCGAELLDGERAVAIRKCEQRSTIPPEVAAKKRWIGVHFSQLYMPGKTIRGLASEWIQGIDDPGVARAFANKKMGDVYESKEHEVTVELWDSGRAREGQPRAYKLGTVPPEVQFLTAGQDSRLLELHWAVWGWGLVRSEIGIPTLCGWLVDCGVEAGPTKIDPTRRTLNADDLFVFDQVLYSRYWARVDGREHLPVAQGFHDSGWQPIGVYEFCRTKKGRAVPSKGAAEDDHSSAPAMKWSAPPRWRIGDKEVSDPALRRADLNTFLLKTDIAGMAETRFLDSQKVKRPRLNLPYDVPSEFVEHLASERLARDGKKRRWVRKGPNHWLDCTVGAYASALNLRPLLPGGATQAETARASAISSASREPIRKRERRRIRTKY